MNTEDKKAAVRAYKERKIDAGIYAIRCTVTGEVWVGRTPNLEAIRNRHWFSLRLGTHTHADLQEAWRAHGEESFTLDVLERLKETDSTLVRNTQLQERLAHWQEKLNARTV